MKEAVCIYILSLILCWMKKSLVKYNLCHYYFKCKEFLLSAPLQLPPHYNLGIQNQKSNSKYTSQQKRGILDKKNDRNVLNNFSST